MDFDLERAPFWEGMDRLLQRADLNVSAIGENWMRIQPGYYANRRFSSSATARVSVGASRLAASLEIELDPRVRLCRVGDAVIQAARDGTGHDIAAKSRQVIGADPSWYDARWEGSSTMRAVEWLKVLPAGSKLSDFAGYVPVSVVTAAPDADLDLRGGARAQVNGWTVTVQETGYWQFSPQFQGGTFVRVDMEPSAGFKLAGLADARMLVELRDATGAPLVLGTAAAGAMGEDGVFHQRLNFVRMRYDQQAADAVRVIVHVPTEIKEAIIPFTFHDVEVR
jgi:hypothetical protein